MKIAYTIEKRLSGSAIIANNQYTVAKFQPENGTKPRELINRANAYDDLLAACQNVLRCFERDDTKACRAQRLSGRGVNTFILDIEAQALHAAIAKAKGETNR